MMGALIQVDHGDGLVAFDGLTQPYNHGCSRCINSIHTRSNGAYVDSHSVDVRPGQLSPMHDHSI